MDISTRDETLIAEYKAGTKVAEICREHGIAERQFYQLMASHKVPRRERVTYENEGPVSPMHEIVGRRVYEFYSAKGFDRRLASNKLGWSALRLRRVETGQHDLTLLDLQELTAFLNTTIGELTNVR